MDQEISGYLDKITSTIKNLDKTKISHLVELILSIYRNDGTIFVFGNGGSAATAGHFCNDLLKGLSHGGRNKRFKAMCLNENIATMMSIANDSSYEEIFTEQLKNFLTPNDLVIAISGSGNSKNIIHALEYSNSINAKTVALCGYDGGNAKKLANLSIHVNINDMEASEDLHIIIFHTIKRVIENHLCLGKIINNPAPQERVLLKLPT
ncbi:MAG: SIS domain-containing protein [Oligoflexia bacterium]|nr:SIS domain-containing protein [Oligoflexia bacterium]